MMYEKIGNIDVGDGCWRQNVLVTIIRYCCRFGCFAKTVLVTNINYHSTQAPGTNVERMSPTSLSTNFYNNQSIGYSRYGIRY